MFDEKKLLADLSDGVRKLDSVITWKADLSGNAGRRHVVAA